MTLPARRWSSILVTTNCMSHIYNNNNKTFSRSQPIYKNIHTYIHTYRGLHTCMHACMHACICTHTHTHTHTHTYKHTYTHGFSKAPHSLSLKKCRFRLLGKAHNKSISIPCLKCTASYFSSLMHRKSQKKINMYACILSRNVSIQKYECASLSRPLKVITGLHIIPL